MRRKCTDSLILWKKNPSRRPLILRGSRQTGKTWLLREFGRLHYDQTLYINLETDRPAAEYLSVPREAQEALLFLESFAGKPIHDPRTLLILDNIQCVPTLPALLTEISLDYPEYHITAIERGFSMKLDASSTEILTLFPLDFEEFLWANSEYGLSREIRAHFEQMLPMGKELHQKAMAQFRLYLICGGMPASILEYRKEKCLLMVPDVQQKILDLFLADICRHAPHSLVRHSVNSWLSIPGQLEKENGKFQYRRILQGATARTYQEPLNWLVTHGAAKRSCRCVQTLDDPDPSSFRLYFPDTGLCARRLGIPSYLILSGEDTPALRSCIETFLAQNFADHGFILSSWYSGNQAEIPFLLTRNGKVTAVDFRLSPRQKARSLARLQSLHGADVSDMYLISAEDFRQRESYDLIPFYAAFCL